MEEHLFCKRSHKPLREVVCFAVVFAGLAALSLSGCGGGGDNTPNPNPSSATPTPTPMASATPTPPVVAVSISPDRATVLVSRSLALSATVQNARDTGILWRVEEGAAGGSVDTNGLYTAPTLAGTYHVSAVSRADISRFATVAISVLPTVGIVSITPTTATVSIGGTQNYTAVIDGISDQRVTWTIQEGSAGGAISAEGLYTAPTYKGQFHIVATSVAQPTQTATVTVDVKSGKTEVTIQ